MNLTIWKYNLIVNDEQYLQMPKGAKILSAQVQHGAIAIWVMVDPRKPKVERNIQMAGTGHDLSERIMGDFIGTIQISGGSLIFHIFDGGEKL